MNDHTKKNFKVRVIVPDGKDSDKDLILVPAKPVGNEEQATEEASLLALLQLTPNLPPRKKITRAIQNNMAGSCTDTERWSEFWQ